MADNLPTIADDIAAAFDMSTAEVSDLLNESPVVSLLPSEESSNGTVHKYTKETGAPVVGFRAENTGRDFSKDTDTEATVSLAILDFSWQVDFAVANACRKGREWYIARKGIRHLKAALFAYECQIFRGQLNGDLTGFVGLPDLTGIDAIADEMTIDAGGSTALTGSSVYGLRLGHDAVTGVMKGEDGIDLGETIVQDAVDGNGKHYPVYYTPGSIWLALQIGGARDIGRIINLTTQADKMLTDDMLADLYSAFPSGKKPTHFALNRRSLGQLRNSRTATSPTGNPAPFPTEWEDVKLVDTDAILNTEAIIA